VTASKKNYPAFRIPEKGCGDYGPRIGEVKITDIASATYEKDNKLTDVFKNLKYYNLLMDSKTKNTFSLLSVSKPQFKEDKKCTD
jgi:hypothetical protein